MLLPETDLLRARLSPHPGQAVSPAAAARPQSSRRVLAGPRVPSPATPSRPGPRSVKSTGPRPAQQGGRRHGGGQEKPQVRSGHRSRADT